MERRRKQTPGRFLRRNKPYFLLVLTLVLLAAAVIFGVKILVIIVAFIAATTADVSAVDSVSDTFMALMGIVNMIIVLLLSRQVLEAYADYRKQKREGVEEPVFHKSVLSDSSGITEWED